MFKDKDKKEFMKKENEKMNATMNQARPCTISESIKQSCKEVKSMREGRTPKRSLSDLFSNIEQWCKEEK